MVQHGTYAPPNPLNPVLTAGAAAVVAEVEGVGVEKAKGTGTGTSELPNPPKDLIHSLID